MVRARRRLLHPLRDAAALGAAAEAARAQLPGAERARRAVARVGHPGRAGLQHRLARCLPHRGRGPVAHDHRAGWPRRRRRAGPPPARGPGARLGRARLHRRPARPARAASRQGLHPRPGVLRGAARAPPRRDRRRRRPRRRPRRRGRRRRGRRRGRGAVAARSRRVPPAPTRGERGAAAQARAP